MSAIWSAINDPGEVIGPIKGAGFRLVESQEKVATTEIVPDLYDQALLEDMLDSSKPAYRYGTNGLHYLLSTPFRYPPLAHGSRFGSRFEPSLFYGGTTEYVTLCESAFYRFFFLLDNLNGPRHEKLQTQHTLFEFQYTTEMGVQLQHSPFTANEPQLRSPVSYDETQALGAAMRHEGVACFEYTSARDPAAGTNVALFEPDALACTRPLSEKHCLCQIDQNEAVFSLEKALVRFPLAQFMVNGDFPLPAI